MVFSDDDRAVIEACHLEKGWGARRILKEFPGRNWNLSSVSYQIKKIKDTGSTSIYIGNKTAVNDDNKAYVEEMIVSQEDQPGTHKSQREISRYLNASRTSVRRMTKELNLKPFKRIRVSRRDNKVKQKRITRSKNLNDRYSIAKVKKLVFTDEKDFSYEVASNRQNDIGCLVRAKKKFLVPDFIMKLVDLPKRLWCRRGYRGMVRRTSISLILTKQK